MDRFSFWQKWLFIVGIIVIAFGILFALFNGTILFKAFNAQMDPVFWGATGVPSDTKPFQQWIYGVLGATMAGWGMFLIFLVHYPFRKKERWAWNGMLAGLLLWYVIDTPISLYYKVYFNALFNTVVFLLALLPLVFTRRYFEQN